MDKTTRIMNRRHSTVIKPYCHLNNLQNEQRMIVCVVLPFWELPRCDCESWRATSRMSVRANTCCEQIKPVVSQVTVMWLWVLFVVLSSSVSRRGKVNNGGYVVTGSRCALHINRPETLTASFWSDVHEISLTTWLLLYLYSFSIKRETETFLFMTKMCPEHYLFKTASNS